MSRIEATLEEWKELYDIAIKLKDLKPWEQLLSMDFITIKESEGSEPIMCSIMGAVGECYGIGAYRGEDAIRDFFLMVDNSRMPKYQLMRYHNNIMCNYGSREELTTQERNIIKELGLKFRGKNNWIYFRVFESGYDPYMPNKDEVLEFTKILKQTYEAIKALNNGMKIDFENDKILMRRFDSKNNEWINEEEDMSILDGGYIVPILQDQLLIKRLKNEKKNNSILELDIVYLNTVIKEKGYDKPIIPRLSLLVDKESGMILSQNMIAPDEDEINIIFDAVINYIIQKGRPKKIIVRDIKIRSILSDLCNKIDVDVLESERLAGIDDFLQNIGFSF